MKATISSTWENARVPAVPIPVRAVGVGWGILDDPTLTLPEMPLSFAFYKAELGDGGDAEWRVLVRLDDEAAEDLARKLIEKVALLRQTPAFKAFDAERRLAAMTEGEKP